MAEANGFDTTGVAALAADGVEVGLPADTAPLARLVKGVEMGADANTDVPVAELPGKVCG